VRFLDTPPPKQYRQVTRKIIMLMADPQPTDAERLKGYDYSRVTVGEYRVIFDVRDGVPRVIAIGKRNDDEVERRPGQKWMMVPSRTRGEHRLDHTSASSARAPGSATVCRSSRASTPGLALGSSRSTSESTPLLAARAEGPSFLSRRTRFRGCPWRVFPVEASPD